MRVLSFLLVSFLCANVCQSYTVVFHSGKQLTGTLLGEDAITIQLRDRSGVVLSIKKSRVDLEATERANAITKPAEPKRAPSNPEQEPPEKSLAEIARELRASRARQSRTYTRTDLSRVPEISFTELPEDVDERESARNVETEPDLKNDESFWRKAAADFRKELARLRERKISAQFSCAKAREKRSASIYGGTKRPTNLADAFEEPAECQRLQGIEAQFTEAEWRWDEFTERARKSEIPLSWIE